MNNKFYFSGEKTSDVEVSPIPIRRLRLIVCINSLNVYPSNSPVILIEPVGRICVNLNKPLESVLQQDFPSIDI
jgi:hypothetical protein